MKNKLGIFTALILSLVIAGSAFALPKTVSARNVSKAKVTKTKKAKKHRRHKRKAVKKTMTKTNTVPTKKQ